MIITINRQPAWGTLAVGDVVNLPDVLANPMILAGEAVPTPAGIVTKANPFEQRSTVATEAAMLALAANIGDEVYRSDTASWWKLSALPASELGNWFSFRAARLHGGNIRASLATAKCSIHASSGIVSVGAGLLIGIQVIAAGSADSTITVYDNASAASGRILRKVYANDPTNVAGGWHDADGLTGIPAANGLYLSMAGTTAPVVLMWFDGTYPDWTDWSGVPVWYFDSEAGNNTTGDGSIGNPYKEVFGFPSNFLAATDVQKVCLFKAGQSHHYGRTVSGSTNMPGTNIKVRFGRYGDAALPNPVLWMDVGDAGNNSNCDATGGVLDVSDIDWEYRTTDAGSAAFTAAQVAAASGAPVLSAPFAGPTGSYMLKLYTSGIAQANRLANVTLTNGATTVTWTGGSTITCDAGFDWEASYRAGSAVSGAAGARIIIDNCSASRFVNGFNTGGNDARVTRCYVHAASSGLYGGSNSATTGNRMLWHANVVPQGAVLKDAATLHDGATAHSYHCAAVCNELYSGAEQCLDIAAHATWKYKNVLAAFNYGYCDVNSTGGIVGDTGCDGLTMVGNEVTGPGTAGPSFMARAPANYIGNVTDRVINNNQGQLNMGDTTAAPGSVSLFNTLVTPSTGATRESLKAGAVGTTGCIFRYNLIVSLSNQRIVNVKDLTGWGIDYNAYYDPAITSGGAGTVNAVAFLLDATAEAKAAWQSHLAGACDANSTFQVNPGLLGFNLPALSQFIAAGSQHTTRYLLWSGLSWMQGPVSIGADEWQGNRRT